MNDDEEPVFHLRGLVWGVALSVPLWMLIFWAWRRLSRT